MEESKVLSATPTAAGPMLIGEASGQEFRLTKWITLGGGVATAVVLVEKSVSRQPGTLRCTVRQEVADRSRER
jgi:hypothetical protein